MRAPAGMESIGRILFTAGESSTICNDMAVRVSVYGNADGWKQRDG